VKLSSMICSDRTYAEYTLSCKPERKDLQWSYLVVVVTEFELLLKPCISYHLFFYQQQD